MKGKKNQFVVEEKKMNEWNQFLPRSRQRSMIRESQEIEMLIRYVAGKRNWQRLTKTHILLLFIHNLLHTLHKILDYKKKHQKQWQSSYIFFVAFFLLLLVCIVCVCVCMESSPHWTRICLRVSSGRKYWTISDSWEGRDEGEFKRQHFAGKILAGCS